MCDLVNNEKDTDKYPNIIEDYNTEKNLLQSIFSSGRKLEKIQYQIYFRQQGMTFKRKLGKQGKNSETYLMC